MNRAFDKFFIAKKVAQSANSAELVATSPPHLAASASLQVRQRATAHLKPQPLGIRWAVRPPPSAAYALGRFFLSCGGPLKLAHHGVIARVHRAHHPVPEREEVAVVVAKRRMMQVVEGGADHRRGPAGAWRGEILEARMADHAGDLVEQPLRKQRERGDRQHEPHDEIIAVLDDRIDGGGGIIAPHGGRDRAVMRGVPAIEHLQVQQPVAPVEPGIVKHHRDREHKRQRPPGDLERGDRPAARLREPAEGEHRRRYRQRRHRRADFHPHALVAVAVLLDPALGIAPVDEGDADAGREIDRHRRAVDDHEIQRIVRPKFRNH